MRRRTLNGYDIDGTITGTTKPVAPYVLISGRTWAEVPEHPLPPLDPPPLAVAVRGVGAYGDVQAAGEFKATMINLWQVDTFYDDDPNQIAIINQRCPGCKTIQV